MGDSLVEGGVVGDILVEGGNMPAEVDFDSVVDSGIDAAVGIAEVDLEIGEEVDLEIGGEDVAVGIEDVAVGIEDVAHIVAVGQEGDWEEEEAHFGWEEVGEHLDHVA